MWAGDDFGNWKRTFPFSWKCWAQFSSWREEIKRPLRWIQDYALVTVATCLTDLLTKLLIVKEKNQCLYRD